MSPGPRFDYLNWRNVLQVTVLAGLWEDLKASEELLQADVSVFRHCNWRMKQNGQGVGPQQASRLATFVKASTVKLPAIVLQDAHLCYENGGKLGASH